MQVFPKMFPIATVFAMMVLMVGCSGLNVQDSVSDKGHDSPEVVQAESSSLAPVEDNMHVADNVSSGKWDEFFGTFSSFDSALADAGLFQVEIPEAWRDGKVSWKVSKDVSGYPRIMFFPAGMDSPFVLGCALYREADAPENVGDVGYARIASMDTGNGRVEYWRDNWAWLAWHEMSGTGEENYDAEQLDTMVSLSSLGLLSFEDCTSAQSWTESLAHEQEVFSKALHAGDTHDI